ncbi:MmgE/PrpD family protein [Tianweitania sp. BSSL-BM11]|uniref:MmgE/PrpD family protein n=1 Tax=Tianweitania aestuarii TaxID=2814886 RepID=A0ABS5S0D5_9HYPH|nr:MmgE/PrpD family protein [Tianweitania aestuarii]MBS9721996.1 MmgE/PrpD family protein [Tianweitania aestuarii]
MTNAAHQLAVAAAGTHFGQAPRQVRAAYRDFMFDTVAVMVAGAAHPSLAQARTTFKASAGRGRASVAGFHEGAPVGVAGLINGAAMTVLQLQDGHRRARGHPMSHVLPAALAVAEDTGASATAFLDAVMAGYEVSTRIGASLGGMQPLLHDTGTFGCIGAAVAAAHLFGRDRDEAERIALIEAAIGNSAAVALFPFRDTCMEGAGVHHLFVGLGVQNGLNAAFGALAGLNPSIGTLERFFGPRAGEAFDPSLLVDGIGDDGQWDRFEIMAAYLKWHPVCAHLGPMVDCLEILRARLGRFDPSALVEVRIETYATALDYDAPDPKSDLAARFSFRHAAALAICFGPLAHDGFSPERLHRSQVTDVAAKVTLHAAGDLNALYPANRPARVVLVFSDGTTETAQVLVPKGDGALALTRDDVDRKAAKLMGSIWSPDHQLELRHLINSVEGNSASTLPVDLGQALRQPFGV